MSGIPDPLRWYEHIDPTRTQIVDCTICTATGNQPCDTHRGRPWCHAGRRWEIGLTHPGNSCGSDIPTTPGTGHRPTIETRTDTTAGHARHHYRGACLGCGWAGEARHDEQTAVEDAHDHAHP